MDTNNIKELTKTLNNLKIEMINITPAIEEFAKAFDTFSKVSTLTNIFNNMLSILNTTSINLALNSKAIAGVAVSINAYTGSLTLATGAQSALNTAIASSGIGTLVLILGSLAASFITSIATTERQKSQLDELTDSVKEQTKSWQELKEKQSDAGREAAIESSHIESLWTELQTLSEKQGKSNDEKERANFLAKELGGYLDEEIKLTEEGTLANEKQAESIGKLVDKKRALATLEALEPGYKEAIIEAGKSEASMRDILTQKMAAQAELEELINNPNFDPEAKSALVSQKIKEISDLDELYAQSEETYQGHLGIMNQYEALSIEAANGNYKTMNDMVETMNTGILTASQASTEALQAQHEEKLNLMDEANRAGREMTESQQALLKENLVKSSEELMESLTKDNQLSQEKRNEIAKSTLEEIINTGNVTQEELETICERLGISVTEGLKLVNGTIDENTGTVSQKHVDIANNATSSFDETYKEGAESMAQTSAEASSQVAASAKEPLEINSPSKVFQRMAESVVEGFNLGISGNQSKTDSVMSIWSSSLSGIFDKTKLPGVSVDISYMTPVSSVLASALKFLNLPGFPKVKFSKMALGGIVEPGQLFLAREAGPELVGTIGSHTAVMNNNMIVESVKRGVYEAVTDALQNGNGSLVVHNHIDLDGREIGKQVVKYHNGIVRQTGVSPFLI